MTIYIALAFLAFIFALAMGNAAQYYPPTWCEHCGQAYNECGYCEKCGRCIE